MEKHNRKGVLSSAWIKVIALSVMVLDHTSVIFFGAENTWLRSIGRICFPLIAFMIAEGVRHTRDIKKYALSMFVFALVSEIPFDIAFNGSVLEFNEQNVYFTLLFGVLSAATAHKLSENRMGVLAIFSTLLFGLLSYFMKGDYGFMGVVVITLMYFSSCLPKNISVSGYAVSALATCIVYIPPLRFIFLSAQLPAVMSAVPLALYSGERGFRINKYYFYAFYPVHLLILTLIKHLLG